MKSVLLFIVFFLALGKLNAQDCKDNLFMTNNAKIEWIYYDEKNSEQGKLNWEISGVK